MRDAREPMHVKLRALGVAAAIVFGGIAIALAVPWAILARTPSPAGAPGNAERPAIAGPVQQTAPRLEREAYEREKRGSAAR